MQPLEISIAVSERDVDDVRQLCRDFVAGLMQDHPEFHSVIQTYFEPVKREETLTALPSLHARPSGAMVMARMGGKPVGCIMYHQMAPGVAEVKRLFVSPDARRGRVAPQLLSAMIEYARKDGYGELCLDTARFMKPAIVFYRSQGFTDSDHSLNFAKEILAVAVFLHRKI